MVALQIRDVPDDVRQALADRAQARGQSLQAFLLSLVVEEASRTANAALLDRFTDRADGTRLSLGQASETVAAARADRDTELGLGGAG